MSHFIVKNKKLRNPYESVASRYTFENAITNSFILFYSTEFNKVRKMGLDIYSHVVYIRWNAHHSNYPLWAQIKTSFCWLLNLSPVPHGKSSDWIYPDWSVWLKTFKNSITFLNCVLTDSLTLHQLGKKNPKTKNQTTTTNFQKTSSIHFWVRMLAKHLFFLLAGQTGAAMDKTNVSKGTPL